MQAATAIFKKAFPYRNDKMNLPVANIETAMPFYEIFLGFHIVSKNTVPENSAVLERDDVKIGLAENGGDPTQEGCFFEVDSVETAFAELHSRGLEKEISGLVVQNHGEASWRVFFVVAPDGLCYCFGEKV